MYAELMTMFDNPKFAVGWHLRRRQSELQTALGTGGGQPRVDTGVTRVVLRDGPEPPKAKVGHLRSLFTEKVHLAARRGRRLRPRGRVGRPSWAATTTKRATCAGWTCCCNVD